MDLENKTDEELVKLIQAGQQTAFDVLYNRYAKLIYYLAYQMCKCKADAEEIVQEVFTKLFRCIQDIKEPKRVKYWLTTVAHNECILLFRSNKDQGFDEQKLKRLYQQTEQRKEFLPKEQSRYESDMEVLRSCIANLSDEQRDVIVLKYFAQLSIEEIAEMLAVPEGTIKSRLAYAKKRLRVDVETYCQTNQLPITFKIESLGTIAFLLMQKECEHLILTPPNIGKPIHLYQPKASMLSSTFAKAGIVVAVCASAGIAGVAFHKNHQVRNPLVQETIQTVIYQGSKVQNAREAYAILKTWAHCDVDLEKKTEEEKEAIRPVYEMLKGNQNEYYILLERYWKNAFE